MNQLKQTYFLSKKEFELTDKKILIKEKSVFHDKEFEARYNEIGLDLIKYRSREGIGNAIFFGGLMIVSIWITYGAFTDGKTDIKLAFFFLLTCFMWGTIVWWSIQKYFSSHFILQGGGKVLDFFINSPDEEAVKEFIEEIRQRVRERMKEDYSTFDPDLEFQDQLENLKYLKRIDVIGLGEFEKIRETLRKNHLIK